MSSAPAEVDRLIDRIKSARSRRIELDIRGGSTKAFYGESPRGEPLDIRELCGISSYEPSELVITARAGTPLEELERAVGEGGQCLPFEPPRFAPGGTVGGMVAAGLSGPSRAAVGAMRDYVLGLTLLTGRGELLTFGGQVMKNVAGYDVSRLIAGSWGVLGVICEVSLKVLAARGAAATLEFEWDERRALDTLGRWNSKPLPVHASAWHEGRLRIRLSGARTAVESACRSLGGAPLDPDTAARWWTGVRDLSHPFFEFHPQDLARGECLWRLSLPAGSPSLELSGAQFIEWGGTQRWWRTRAPAVEMRRAAANIGGHATLVRAADKSPGAFAPVTPPLMRIHRALKNAFDPDRIFNPGRLYADL